MTRLPTIHQVLRDELHLQTRHRQLLESQQAALLACDRARFCALHDDYSALLVELNAQQDVRKAILRHDDGSPLTLTLLLELLPETSCRRLRPVRESLQRTLERVQALNRQNQQLIENELNYIAFSLDLCVEAGRKNDNGYGGGGGGRLLLDRSA